MPKKTAVTYTVVRDSDEKRGKGWLFPAGEHCTGTVVRKLKTGDYSLEGYEDVFAVERKGRVEEFVQNLTSREKWANFKAELERLESFQAGFVVCEFTIDDVMRYPQTTRLPWAVRRKVRVKPHFYLKRMQEIELHFRTRLKLLGPVYAREYVASLFKRVAERWPRPQT